MHHHIADIKSYCNSEFKTSPSFTWDANKKNLRGRDVALQVLKNIKEKDELDIFLDKDDLPVIVNSLDAIYTLLKKRKHIRTSLGMHFIKECACCVEEHVFSSFSSRCNPSPSF